MNEKKQLTCPPGKSVLQYEKTKVKIQTYIGIQLFVLLHLIVNTNFFYYKYNIIRLSNFVHKRSTI